MFPYINNFVYDPWRGQRGRRDPLRDDRTAQIASIRLAEEEAIRRQQAEHARIQAARMRQVPYAAGYDYEHFLNPRERAYLEALSDHPDSRIREAAIAAAEAKRREIAEQAAHRRPRAPWVPVGFDDEDRIPMPRPDPWSPLRQNEDALRRREEDEEAQERDTRAIVDALANRHAQEERRQASEREEMRRRRSRSRDPQEIYFEMPRFRGASADLEPTKFPSAVFRARTQSPNQRQPLPPHEAPHTSSHIRPDDKVADVAPADAAEEVDPSEEPPSLPTASPEESRAALATISSIETAFKDLQAHFVAPSHLDYLVDGETVSVPAATVPLPPPAQDLASDTEDKTRTAPKLAFTAPNRPLHQYYEDLNRLLGKLDAIESGGDAAVRAQRRSLVRGVEGEAIRIERWTADVWATRQEDFVQRGSEATEKAEREANVRHVAPAMSSSASMRSTRTIPVPDEDTIIFRPDPVIRQGSTGSTATPSSLSGANSQSKLASQGDSNLRENAKEESLTSQLPVSRRDASSVSPAGEELPGPLSISKVPLVGGEAAVESLGKATNSTAEAHPPHPTSEGNQDPGVAHGGAIGLDNSSKPVDRKAEATTAPSNA